jgi:hypothetical protein
LSSGNWIKALAVVRVLRPVGTGNQYEAEVIEQFDGILLGSPVSTYQVKTVDLNFKSEAEDLDLHILSDKTRSIWSVGDIILLQSFAWNGLVLGFLAIHKVQMLIAKSSTLIKSWAFVIFALVVSSFGIYLGRFWRWNSWDLIFYPVEIMGDIRNILFYPKYNLSSIGLTLFFSCFLIVAYYTFYSLMHKQNS